jgi:hypothetical protein
VSILLVLQSLLSVTVSLGIASLANWIGNLIVVSSFLSTVKECGTRNTFGLYLVRFHPSSSAPDKLSYAGITTND